MSKKKKRHPSAPPSARPQNAPLGDGQAQSVKRLQPAARNLFLVDLVFLSVCELMNRQGMISLTVSNFCSILGIIMLFGALWFQFCDPKRAGGSGRSRPLGK